MLDVWKPVADLAVKQGSRLSWKDLLECSRQHMETTRDRAAKKGRAAYLGERAVGHLDPGAVSTCYLFEAAGEDADKGGSDRMSCVGIVLVSHSAELAEGLKNC